jgi:hypothetical protein
MNREDIQNALFGNQSKIYKEDSKSDKKIDLKSVENSVINLLVKEGFEIKKIVPVVAAFMDNLTRAI